MAAGIFLLLFSFCLSFATDPAAHTLLLDGAFAGNAIVAVGERGTILRSTDEGATWTATKPITMATLTAVSFADAQHGWAVGHDALVLATSDGGTTWAKQWQGDLTDSFLDVMALDAHHVIAIGAYCLYVTSRDGGQTWERQRVLSDDSHLNRISRGPSGTLYIAGEHGTILRSKDNGERWTPIPTPYAGSFYGVLPLDNRTLLAYGLRGRLFRSADDGRTWSPELSGEDELLATAVRLKADRVVLAGQARCLIVGTADAQTFARRDANITTAIAELLELPSGDLLAFGEAGATRIAAATLR